MKRCPQCNRVETDETLKFCRVEGVSLTSESSVVDHECGTIQLGSPSSSEIATGVLPTSTNANINLNTGPTTILPHSPELKQISDVRGAAVYGPPGWLLFLQNDNGLRITSTL